MNNTSKNRIKQGYTSVSPVPTQIVSNEEFVPPPQTFKQAQVEWLIDRASKVPRPKGGAFQNPSINFI